MTSEPNQSPTDDDDALLQRISVGDAAAMKVLYERHARGLGSFVNLRLRDAPLAMDIVQDTFLEVWLTASRFQGRSSARSWIYAIARNKAVDLIRKKSHERWVESDETIPDLALPTHDSMEAFDDAARLTECLNGLSDAQRSAVNLAFYQGLSYREIAIIEAVSEGTIKSRVHHAKRLLLYCLSRPKDRSVQPG